MYFCYGWPKILRVLDAKSTDKVVYLSTQGSLLVIVTSSTIQTWTSGQHRVKLGQSNLSSRSFEDDGPYIQALWSSQLETLAVLTKNNLVHFYDISPTDKAITFPGYDASFNPVKIKFRNRTYIPLFEDETAIKTMVADDDNILLGLSNGRLHLLSWRGQLRGTMDLFKDSLSTVTGSFYIPEANGPPGTPRTPKSTSPFSPSFAPSPSLAPVAPPQTGGVLHLHLCPSLALLSAVFLDGRVLLCSLNPSGSLRPLEGVSSDRWVGVLDAVCTSVGIRHGVLAVGTKRGTVELFSLTQGMSHLRTLSLVDWGYSLEDTGAVSSLLWSPDGWALAVGWSLRGLTLWSVSGCRLMCTIPQGGGSTPHQGKPQSPGNGLGPRGGQEPVLGGVCSLSWGEQGYQLLSAEKGVRGSVVQFGFAKGCLNPGLGVGGGAGVGTGGSCLWQVMKGEDRLLLIQSDEQDELKVQHLIVPPTYLAPNWPLRHVAFDREGAHVAVSGTRGVTVHSLRTRKWRVFGDVAQERQVDCAGLAWLGKVLAICAYSHSSRSYNLLLYPRFHLDESSLLVRQPVQSRPFALDSHGAFLLVACAPLELQVYFLEIQGDLSPVAAKPPKAKLHLVRELSLVSPRGPLQAIRFVPPSPGSSRSHSGTLDEPGVSYVQDRVPGDEILDGTEDGEADELEHAVKKQPTECILLRTDGCLSLLDLSTGRERALISGVEHFWLTQGRPREEKRLIQEVPWWAYGYRGMQVWYPSSQSEDSNITTDPQQLSPELDFDREVYPLGVSPLAGVIVGVSQRLSLSSVSQLPCFEPTPQAQPILPCLLRHLLQRNKLEEAVQLASLSSNRPHFSHSLEWLLFTVFDASMTISANERRARARSGMSEPALPSTPSPGGGDMLERACSLVRHFPEYLDIVVSVARKTDSRHWPQLFAYAGRSTVLFEQCFDRKQYRTATCYILVIEKLEGPTKGQQSALRLLQATLHVSMYHLAGELVRFLLRSGREFSSSEAEDSHSEGLIKSFFNFGFTSGAPKARADVLHLTVKNILGDHSLHLLAMKELREIVHFLKSTEFDFPDFLKSHKGKEGRLEDFSAALKIIRLKLNPLDSAGLGDAEFLLTQMQAAEYHEWIVVLATILQLKNVLVGMFRKDVQLWFAYEKTMKMQSNFSQLEHLLTEVGNELRPFLQQAEASNRGIAQEQRNKS